MYIHPNRVKRKTDTTFVKQSAIVSFILVVEIYPEKYHEVISLLLENKFLRKVYTTTGECRVHCIGFAPNYRTLESHVNHLYRIS